MTDSQAVSEQAAEARQGGLSRWLLIGVGGFIGTIVVLFGIAVIGGIADSDGVANFFRILRDLFIVILALQSILIAIALVILIAQISTLINILSSEVKPIIEEAQETVSTARDTTEFISRNVATPVIRMTSTAVGVGVFMRELLAIRRNLSGKARK
jgi:spore maturation protein SpmA